jgi:hypothetical protein
MALRKIRKESGYCGPFALKYLTGLPDKTILDACVKNGFKKEWGMEDYELLRAARALGLKYRREELKPVGLYGAKLREFARRRPRGRYLVYTSNHVLLVSNGVIIDPINSGYVGEDRAVTGAWKITP